MILLFSIKAKKLFKKVLTRERIYSIIKVQKRQREVIKMFKVIMIVDNEEYTYGTYSNRDKANEIAMEIRE